MSRLRRILFTLLSSCTLVIGYPSIEIIFPERSADTFQKPEHGSNTQVVKARQGPAPNSTTQIYYQNGRMTDKIVFWNNQPWEHTLFEYQDDLSRYSVQTMVYHGEKAAIVRKDLFQTSKISKPRDQKIKTWHYYFDKDRANALRQVDTYWPDTTLVRERKVFDAFGTLKAAAIFEYDAEATQHQPDENEDIATTTRMTLMDGKGTIVSDYREIVNFDLETLYHNSGYTTEEINRRLKIAQDRSRTPVLIMDGGIDISHPDLAYKLWKNPDETPNGLDDDGNGLTDDIYGISDNPRLSQPVYDLRLPRFGLPAPSHGTLVASIAAHGREDIAIMSVSEMTTVQSTELLPRIERLIKSHDIRFTNMSFIFDTQLLAHGPHAHRAPQIRTLIANTPDTLHIVAAGNGAPFSGKGFNVDKYRSAGDLIPVMLPAENILVVGALDTDRLVMKDFASYQLAPFSNVGERSVDILAPGIKMCGARMGGGILCEDGTSYAAPYTLNHGVLAVAEANPHLNIYEIKDLLMKTAYIPDLDNPYPVRSGGILYPRRAVAAARWMTAQPGSTVEAAVLAVRKAEPNPIAGENNTVQYLKSLQSFWHLRQKTSSPSWYALREH